MRIALALKSEDISPSFETKSYKILSVFSLNRCRPFLTETSKFLSVAKSTKFLCALLPKRFMLKNKAFSNTANKKLKTIFFLAVELKERWPLFPQSVVLS